MSKPYIGHYAAEFNATKNFPRTSEQAINIGRTFLGLLGLTVVNEFAHEFSPHGISLIIVIAESHLAIHTWPEHNNYVHLDLVSCAVIEKEKIEKTISDTFCPKNLTLKEINIRDQSVKK